MCAQPRGRPPNQTRLLARVHRCLRRSQAARPSRLHLDEYDQGTAPGDDVHLDAAGSDVSGDDAITSCFEERSGAGLAFGAEGAASGA